MRVELDILDGQVAVFDPTLHNPLHDWTPELQAQGFAWRPGSVSFATFDEDGKLTVEITGNGAAPAAERIIAVPFTVPADGRVELASVLRSVVLVLPPGEVDLTFSHGRDDRGAMWARLGFKPVEATVSPRLLRVDSALTPPVPLIVGASPH